MEALASKVGRRGTVVLPAKLRRRLGIEEGSFVVAEEREDELNHIWVPRVLNRLACQQY